MTLKEAKQYGEEVHIDLWYPRSSEVKYILVGLMDVRASDGIRISFDFERNGYKIEQASKFSWDANDDKCDPDWQEVAFVESWAREIKLPEESSNE